MTAALEKQKKITKTNNPFISSVVYLCRRIIYIQAKKLMYSQLLLLLEDVCKPTASKPHGSSRYGILCGLGLVSLKIILFGRQAIFFRV